jgi:hypothetical protein
MYDDTYDRQSFCSKNGYTDSTLYRPILRTGYMTRPLISSFLLGESTQLQKGNLSAAERGLSAIVTKFLLGRFYCHIADWPCQGARISAALCSPPRVYSVRGGTAGSRRHTGTVSHRFVTPHPERSVHDWRGIARRMLFNRDPRLIVVLLSVYSCF